MGSLRTFIKSVRYSKTIADERSVIRKESAAIRTAFKDVNLSNSKRRTNIQKLLYLYILGEKTHFGQIECIKLLASNNFVDKRLGYLAASLLLDENQEILTLLTNSLVQDLMHPNQFFVALALSTLATVLSYDLSNDTYNSVLSIMSQRLNPYLKKKAILVSAKMVEKNPDLIELFYETCLKQNVIDPNEKDHAVLIAGCELVKSFYQYGNNIIKTSILMYIVPKLLTTLNQHSSTNYYPEYDIMGVADPFLYVSLLQTITFTIRLPQAVAEAELNTNHEELEKYKIPSVHNITRFFGTLNDEYNDLLTQISSTIEFGKNAGNLVLYEVVRSIFQLKNSNSALKVLGINLLGRFLTLKDNNIRYISLNTLLTVVKFEPKTVQRHQTIILKCLFDHDISIKRRALELVFEILNEKNIKVLIKDLERFLVMTAAETPGDGSSNGFNEFNMFSYNLSKDSNDFSLNGSLKSNNVGASGPSLDTGSNYTINNLDLKYFITTKLSILLRSYSPNLGFFFKYLIVLLDLNGNYLTNDIISFILSIVSNIANGKPVDIGTEGSGTAAENQALIKQTLVEIFNLSSKKLYNNGLNLINIWCLGEYGEMVLGGASGNGKIIDGSAILDYLQKVSHTNTSQLIDSYVLTALLKLSRVLHGDISSLAKIESLIRSYSDSININLQMKASEYLEILAIKDESVKYGLLERIPPPTIKEIGKVSLSNNSEEETAGARINSAAATDNFLLDLMDDGDNNAAGTGDSGAGSGGGAAKSNADVLSDIFGTSNVAPAASGGAFSAGKSSSAQILDLFGNSSSTAAAPAASASKSLDIFGSDFGATTAPSAASNNKFLNDSKYVQIFNNEDVTIKLLLVSLESGAAAIEIYIVGNSSSTTVTNFNLLIAVAKSQKLVIVPTDLVTQITSSNFYKQDLKITGKVGSKLKLRVKFNYQANQESKNILFDYNLGKTL